MSTLTDRYVWAVVRLLPEAQRDEIDRELHELIAEMTDARQEAAGEPDAAERAVLEELGDPGRLAARYVEHPRGLIGPEVFPEYLRILKLLLAIAVPIITGLAVLGTVLDDDSGVGDVAGAAIGAAFNSAIQVAFWVTLVYAFADQWKADSPWTPDKLPDLPTPSPGWSLSDTVMGIVFTVLAMTALVWQHVRPFVRDGGDGVPVLHPDLWDGPGQAIVAVLGAGLVVLLVALTQRRWTYALASLNLAVNGALLALVTWLAFDERLVNPRLLEVVAERADWARTPSVNPWIVVGVFGAIALWDSVETFRNAWRCSNPRPSSTSAA